MAVTPLPPALPAERAFSLLDMMKRIQAMPHTSDYKAKAPPCETVIHVGIIFDGTNNKTGHESIESTCRAPKRVGLQSPYPVWETQ